MTPRTIRSKLLSLVITVCLILSFFVFLNSIETGKVAKRADYYSAVETGPKRPGAYLKYSTPVRTSHCKLNYGLPTQLVYEKRDLSGSPELQDSSPFSILYNVIEGRVNETAPGVTYATQLTQEFVPFLAEVVKYWEGPVSVAAYLPDGDPKAVLENVLHYCHCVPEMAKVSLHFVFKKETELAFYLSSLLPPKTCDTQHLIATTPSNNNQTKAVEDWYPINVCRNAARQAANTEYVLVCDVELMPSDGLASRFIDMTETYKCPPSSDCSANRVFVVPVFEVASGASVPGTKSELVALMKSNKAVYFHQHSCVHCQKFPGLEQWKGTDPGNLVKPLIETKREVPYDRWEPIFIGTTNDPLYPETLSWEGFQDKMLQMYEMCLANYKLWILDGAFLVHWPGIKLAKRKDEPWRLPYVRLNQKRYNLALENITSRYPAKPKCKAKRK